MLASLRAPSNVKYEAGSMLLWGFAAERTGALHKIVLVMRKSCGYIEATS